MSSSPPSSDSARFFAAIYCSSSRRTKLILWATLSERTELGRGRVRYVLRRWLAARADRVIVNGASGERSPPSRLPSREDRPSATTGPSGVSERRRDLTSVHARPPPDLRGTTHRAQRSGSLHPPARRLGSHTSGQETELTIVGSGPLRHEIENIPHVADLEIKLTGELDPLALSAHFAGADALVFPTLADEWGSSSTRRWLPAFLCSAAFTARRSWNSKTGRTAGCSTPRTRFQRVRLSTECSPLARLTSLPCGCKPGNVCAR